MRRKGSAMAELSRRFHARLNSDAEFAANLSNMIVQHVQSVKSDSGDLNVSFSNLSARRGAPFGNGNRLVRGFRTREWDQFHREIGEHIKASAELVARLKY